MPQVYPLPLNSQSKFVQDSATRCDNGASRGVAQSGSAPALGAGGPQFESERPDHPENLPSLASASWTAVLGLSLVVGSMNSAYDGTKADGAKARTHRICLRPNMVDGFPSFEQMRAAALSSPQRAATAPSSEAAAAASPNARRGGVAVRSVAALEPQILLVDDDPIVLKLTQTVLAGAGYRVATAANASEAIRAFHRQRGIGLVVTDVHMPGLNGLELAEMIAIERPATPIVVMSGAILTVEQMALIRRRSWSFVDKPLSVPRLLSVISILLRRPCAPAARAPVALPKAG